MSSRSFSLSLSSMILVLSIFVLATSLCEGKLVVTPVGPIRGQDEVGYNTYLGVPYALINESSPFGVSLRQPKFVDSFKADTILKCPQALFIQAGSLQCLRLNIFVPKTIKKNLPVLVWFHGGAFLFGSAGEYDPKHFMPHDIIVVTANYRLGPYGFFCLNTDEIPGNQGLRDQVTALKWVSKNIAAFGGNPNKVTIAGESYGGGAVELHLYAKNKKLFDKVIIQSGAAEDEAMFATPNEKAAYELAKVIKPDIEEGKALSFLATKDPLTIMTAFNKTDLLLRACKEKEVHSRKIENFITANSFLHAPKRVADTPIMIGYTSKETYGDFISLSDDYYQNAQGIFAEKIGFSFKFDKKQLEQVAQDAKEFYLGNKTVSKETMLQLVDFVNDFIINYPMERAVTRFLDQNGLVYKYLFSYTGNSPYKNISGVGAYHTEELPFLFDWSEGKKPEGADSLLMRDRMTALWANFVKYGNPTPKKTDLLPVKWERTTHARRSYLNIDLNMEMQDNVYEARMKYWENFWSQYEKYFFLNK